MEIVCRQGRTSTNSLPLLLPNGGNREDRDTFHVSFDPPSEDVVEVVVRAVATIQNVHPHELTPLQTAIDTEALDRLVGPPANGWSTNVEVTFPYQKLEITVSSDGDIWLQWQ